MPSPTPTPGDEPRQTSAPDGADGPEVRAAVEDLAQRQGVAVEDVSVTSLADVTWSDGSLGCPEPGMMYTQALVPGHQLVLAVGGETFNYHAAQGRPFSYCADPQPPSTATNPDI